MKKLLYSCSFRNKARKPSLHHILYIGCILLSACGSSETPDFTLLDASDEAFQGKTTNNKVDILWVVDNSGSMATKQDQLADSFASFAAVLVEKEFNFRMAIVTTDTRSVASGGQAGLFQGSVLDNDTANFISTFQANIKVGDAGSPASKALDAVLLSLNSTNLAGSNAGFLREDAHLAVIIVSDADDNDSSATTNDVISFLDGLKPAKLNAATGKTERQYSVSAVAVDTSNTSFASCDDPFEDGLKFTTLANAVNGTFASICESDFSAGLVDLSEGIASVITQIVLSRAPNLSTVEVFFNDERIPESDTNGWRYISDSQAIKFSGDFIPKDNTQIKVFYTPNDIIR